MKKSVLVPLAPGFEEIEAVTIVDVLRRAGVHVVTASLGARDVGGAHDMSVRADVTLDAARSSGERFDAVVLPGGMPGATNLRDDPRVIALLRDVVEKGGTAAAICAAPIALEAAGLLKGRRATCYPSFRDQLVSASARLDAHVVEDGHIVTSAGPGTAIEFALALVARLAGREAADKVRAGMLVHAVP
jgi:4-methyl-5(b-hydroxyethyl)-thiazole monophosphate biosynthesis